MTSKAIIPAADDTETKTKDIIQTQSIIEKETETDYEPKIVTDEIILEVIDRGLGALGNKARKALWDGLGKDFGFSRQSVPENLEDFEEALQKFFGLGYKFLGSLFKKHLSELMEEKFNEDQSFSQCVSYLRSKTASVE